MTMINRIKELSASVTKELTKNPDAMCLVSETWLEKFTHLIVKEHINILRNEWYRLNNLPADPNETQRDVGLRVGRKSEIIVLIEQIKKHFGVEE